jgi:predicted ATPase
LARKTVNVMRGIYLTEESKKVIENKIAELEVKRDQAAEDNDEVYANRCIGEIFSYYEILSSATILVEES